MNIQKQKAPRVLLGWVLLLLGAAPSVSLAQREAPSSVNGALRLRTTRLATDWVTTAEAAFAVEQKTDFNQWLDRLRSEPLLPSTDGAISGPRLAARFSRQMNADQWSVFTRTMTPERDHAWQTWLAEPTTEGLSQYCQHFGDLEATPRGWLKLATRLRDDGRWEMAGMAWERAAGHPGLTAAQRILLQKGLAEVRQQTTGRAGSMGAASLSEPTRTQVTSTETALPLPTLTEESPSPLVHWKHRFELPNSLEASWTKWQTEMRTQGASLIPAAEPLILDSQIFVRSVEGLVAVHALHGHEIWSRKQEEWDWLDRSPGSMENLNFRQTFLDQFGRRMLADTVVGKLSGDQQRLYLVQFSRHAEVNGQPPWPMPVSTGRDTVIEPTNTLVALNRTTGKFIWNIGGASLQKSYPLAETYFCGPPLVVDDLLFVVAQQRGELQCLTIRAATGELLWKTVLGDVPRAMSVDPLRQRVGCTPVFVDGLILCPTAAGAVVAIDPLSRSVAWGVRYGISFTEAASRPRVENTAYLPDPWWEGWREVQIIPVADGVVIASPESDRLHALETSSGRVKWSIPREKGLLLIAAPQGDVLVVEQGAVRLHHGGNGGVRWRTEVGDVSGRGVLMGNQLLLPTVSQGIAEIDVGTGVERTETRETWTASPPEAGGSLQRLPQGWLMPSLGGLVAFNHLSADRQRLEQELKEHPADSSTLQALVRVDLAQGRADEARNRWESISAKDMLAPELNWQIWKSQLARSPQHWPQLEQSFPGLNQPAERVHAQLALARAAHDQQDIAGAARLLLQGLEMTRGAEGMLLENPHRQVRADLALLGELNALLQGPAEQAAVVQTLCRERWAEAGASSDPFALQTLAELWKPLSLADDLLASAGDEVFIGQSLAARELRWLKGARSSASETALRARERLIHVLQESGFEQDAVDYAQHFQKQTSHAPESWKQLKARTPTQWPARLPEVERLQERNDHVHYFPVPLDGSSSPLFERLDVSIERQGRKVRFAGAGHPGVWEISLPASNSSFRYLQQHVAGWGRGRTLILRVGFELFGLLPLDDAGDPAAVVLWHLDMLGGGHIAPDRLRLEIIPAIAGVREEEYRVLDPFGHIVGQVGPVNSETLCYAEKGMLVSIDLYTGQRRWARFDIEPGSLFGGNEDVVTLWHPERKEITWLSAIDGRTLGQRLRDVAAEQVVFQSDHQGWWLTAKGPRELVCEDLLTGDIAWKTALAEGAAVSVLDPTTLAIVDPRGTLQLVNAHTSERSEPVTVEGMPDAIDRVISAKDIDRWYVALSRQVPQQAGLQQAQLRSGYRSPFVTGPLVAISRRTGQKEWQLPLEREPFPMDQPRTLPVLSQIYKSPSADLQAGQVTDGIVKLTDKRTGTRVLDHRSADVVGYATFSADLPRGVVKLHLEHDTLSLWYRQRPPAPELPARE